MNVDAQARHERGHEVGGIGEVVSDVGGGLVDSGTQLSELVDVGLEVADGQVSPRGKQVRDLD